MESPERSAPAKETGNRENKLETGANTPVGVKVRRLQEKINRESKSHSTGQQIQPTLRSFIDLRGGLVGSQRRTGENKTPSSSPKTRAG